MQKENKLVEAEREYRKAIEIDPEYASAYYALGVLLTKIGLLVEAEKYFDIDRKLRNTEVR